MTLRSFLCWPAFALWASVAAAAPPTDETLRVAVHLGAVRDASRADVEASLSIWAAELSKVIEVPAQFQFFDTVTEIKPLLQAGKVNFVIADGLDLVRNFEPGELVDGFGGVGPREESVLLLANKDAGMRSARDLAGKRVVLLADNGISDLLLRTICLRSMRHSCAQAALAVSKVSRSRQQVLKVFFASADAALVRGYAYELAAEMNPQVRDRVQIVERIALYPGAFGLFSHKVSQKFRDYVISRVPLIRNYPRGRQMMEVMQSEQIGPVPAAALEPIRALMREHDDLYRKWGAENK